MRFIVFVIYAIKHLKETPVAFHNGSAYYYRLIIKQLAKEFDSQFEYLRENTKKYITFFSTY